MRRRPPLHRRGARARLARHHRTGHQPHLRPAPLVPARAQAPSPDRRRAISMSGRTTTRNMPARASSSSTRRNRTGPGTRRPRPITGIASIRTSPISISTIRRCFRSVLSVMRYWLDMGVDGLRLDAVPYLVEREGTNNENLPETHAILKQMREYHRYDTIPIACCWPKPINGPRTSRNISAHGDECHMVFHFPLMPRMYMAIAQEDRFPDHRHHPPDAGHSGQLPMGDLSAQPRRADARNGDGQGTRLSVERLCLGPPGADQSRHPPAACAAAGTRPPAHRADELAAVSACRERRSSITATRSAWATTSIWATATACARPCNGRRTAMAASRAADPGLAGARRRSWTRSTAIEAVNVEAQWRDPHSLLNWLRRMLVVRRRHQSLRPRHLAVPDATEPQGSGLSARIRGRDAALRRQCLAHGAGRRAGTQRIRRPHAGRAYRRHGLSADRPTLLSADAAALTASTGSAQQPTGRSALEHRPYPDPRRNCRPSCCATGCSQGIDGAMRATR